MRSNTLARSHHITEATSPDSHLIYDIYRQDNQGQVVDDHSFLQLEGFAVGHKPRASVQYEENISKQNSRHADWTLH